MGAGKLLWGWYKEGVPPIWVPLQVDADGKVIVDMSAIKLNDLADVDVAGVADDDLFYYDLATGLWKSRKLVDADIPAAIARDAEVADAIVAYAAPLIHAARHGYLGADEFALIRPITQRGIPFLYKNWADINGFTAAHTGSGGFTIGWVGGTLYTGVTNNSEGIIRSTSGLWQAYASYGYSWGMKVSIRQGTTQTIWIGFLATPATPSLTQAHIAFYLDTSGDLWASSGNGTNGTQTDTGINITAQADKFLSIYADNVGIYYYVDHVLVATHLLASSYYPNAVGCYYTMYIKNATDGATRDMYCYPLNMFAMFAY